MEDIDRLCLLLDEETDVCGRLSTVLRDRAKVELSDPGIAKALEIGRTRQAAKDSTAKKDSAAGPTGMQPAPGPAPVPSTPAPGN